MLEQVRPVDGLQAQPVQSLGQSLRAAMENNLLLVAGAKNAIGAPSSSDSGHEVGNSNRSFLRDLASVLDG